MDYREESFRQKFSGAGEYLAVRPEQMVSPKLRENVNSYGDYRQLVKTLRHEVGLHCSEIQANLQGHGYLVDNGRTKVIIVEHETGLELLYLAGSIAFLIGLVPLVLHAWRALRAQSSPRHAMFVDGIEIRRIDSSGHLQEEHVHDRHLGSFMAIGSTLPALAMTAGLIEEEIKLLRQEVQTLGLRMDTIEKHQRLSTSTSVRTKVRPKGTRPRGKKTKKS